jgi:hypothetical protein
VLTEHGARAIPFEHDRGELFDAERLVVHRVANGVGYGFGDVIVVMLDRAMQGVDGAVMLLAAVMTRDWSAEAIRAWRPWSKGSRRQHSASGFSTTVSASRRRT